MNTKALAVIGIVIIAGAAAGILLLGDKEAAWPDDDAKYREVEVTAFMYSADPDKESTVSIRYYEDSPSIPYISMKEYYDKLQKEKLTAYHEGNGVFTLDNHKKGAGSATLDVNKRTISSDNYMKFTSISNVNNEEKGIDFPLIKTVDNTFLKPAGTTTVDLAKYGIAVHTDKDSKNIWVPFQTAADLFINGANYYAFIIGDGVFFIDQNCVMGDRYFLTDEQVLSRMYSMISETWQRPAEMCEYSYNEMCLVFDVFYGKPGLGAISDLQAKYGLDKALDMYDDNTRLLKEYLKSPEWSSYLAGMKRLGDFLYDGGHTNTGVCRAAINNLESRDHMKELIEEIDDKAAGIIGPALPAKNAESELTSLRTSTWKMERLGSGAAYHEEGDTAVYIFNSFNLDADGWTNYMKDGGDLPDDCVGNLYRALKKADSNPAIDKFVIDLTTNKGGYVADAILMNGLMTADNVLFQSLDTLMGQVVQSDVACDINLDGKFDEKDHEKPYRFDYGILTSKVSYSCGNLMPVLAQHNGIMILGESSGGGSCNMEVGTSANAMLFSISGSDKTVVGYGEEGYDENTVEKGTVPDAVLVIENPDGTVDYSGMYDVKTISEKMEEFYAEARTPIGAAPLGAVPPFFIPLHNRPTMVREARCSHILVDSQQEAYDIYNQINAGANFAQLAMQRSKCPSKYKGGDLGWFGRGQMVKPFEDAAFGYNVGDMTVIQTQFGWHVIYITGQRRDRPCGRQTTSPSSPSEQLLHGTAQGL